MKNKNIWLLPTEKPSRLVLETTNNNLFLTTTKDFGTKIMQFQNIYITNSDKIKVGDWFLNDMNILFKADKNYIENPAKEVYIGHKKIILTTNRELIKDGVQAINDEFLEWFVNNPSCEDVEVIEQYRKCCRNTDGKNENCIEPINCEGWLNNEYERPYKTNCEERFEGYKIIIPKDESNKTHYLDELPNMDREVLAKMWESAIPKLEPKQKH